MKSSELPTISIIMIAWNNEEHIQQALESCLTSSFTSSELIIIDNNSKDSTLKKAAKILTSKTINYKIIKNPKNHGPGIARNIGLNYALGRYIAFIDADDWFEPNAIEYMNTLISRHKSDIIMFNHYRAFLDKKTANIPNRYIKLTTKNKKIKSYTDRKDLLNNVHYAWNKIYKKSFLDSINIKFEEGFYEDTLWSIKTTTQAKTIYYTGKCLINYRQRDGSITQTLTDKHLEGGF